MSFAPATDCHVHLLPRRLTEAIRSALGGEAGWSFQHSPDPTAIEETLLSAGVERYISLPYAHRPGMAADLNDWVLEWAAASEACVPFATVHPEDDVREVVRAAFDGGARGLKFQCPVQECSPDDPRLAPAFELAAERDRSVLFHAGTAPLYEESPYVGVDRFRAFCASYPNVSVCCAHMGTYETDAFLEVLADNEQAFLDTSFAMADSEYVAFDADSIDNSVFETFAGQIMYGSDFPNIPHAYRAERAGLLARDLSSAATDALFRGAADRFLGTA
ncbi:amidohydrolase domain protein [Natronomonas pharaonis DSM 2160]|uniref:Amidohydrolase domain protein n=1 Tax=Natronomonas pharaonis (strain ATCC 35678 / DSM 2160 / CIP 103997 / JCM 8858 / NBRC 14720 / NCIMB 2260 / Gabara) TaxID=348780 RepID=A0A1U7EWL6_NATPD|nr:amidohydrolase family protein [Natronomonas pharaonis]CAI49461.1 amidohydrolase domain protein [Natronomonas pharaonis DSM 2160]